MMWCKILKTHEGYHQKKKKTRKSPASSIPASILALGKCNVAKEKSCSDIIEILKTILKCFFPDGFSKIFLDFIHAALALAFASLRLERRPVLASWNAREIPPKPLKELASINESKSVGQISLVLAKILSLKSISLKLIAPSLNMSLSSEKGPDIEVNCVL